MFYLRRNKANRNIYVKEDILRYLCALSQWFGENLRRAHRERMVCADAASTVEVHLHRIPMKAQKEIHLSTNLKYQIIIVTEPMLRNI